MKIKDVYDKFWSKPKTVFEDYDRNLVLPTLIPKVTSPLEVLDLGCGDGAVSDWLIKRGYDVTSLDFNELALTTAKERHLPNLMLCDAEKPLPFNEAAFDIVFWGDVVEHLFDPESTLMEIYRVLKSDGCLVMSCPNVGYIGFRFRFLLTGSIRSLELAGQEPWEQDHIRFFNSRDLRLLLLKTGFRESRRQGVNRLWHSRLLAKIIPEVFGYIQVIEAKKL